jgi:predicted esterase
MFKKLLITIFISTILLTTLLYFLKNDDKNIEEKINKEEILEKENEQEKLVLKKFDKTPAYKNAPYFEEIVTIDNQPMYYAYPLEIDENNPPKLIIYSHGQLQRIVNNLEDEYMLKMKEYGEFFASRDYVFSASNQHDDNWGQRESLDDIKKTIEWFENNEFPAAEKYHMIGFSMGGRTTINYAVENSEKIGRIALLAPTPKLQLTQNDVNILKPISIKIWHGIQDVNIPFSTSTQYVQIFENYGKEIDLVPIENAGHFDIETTLMHEILGFFENYLPH